MCIVRTALSYSLRIRIDQKLEGAAKTRTHAYECEQQLNNFLHINIRIYSYTGIPSIYEYYSLARRYCTLRSTGSGKYEYMRYVRPFLAEICPNPYNTYTRVLGLPYLTVSKQEVKKFSRFELNTKIIDT